MIRLWADFLVSSDPRRCFILRGYAGTGKTSLLSALVRAMSGMQVPCVLLAPTGRAAKVMSRYSGMPAYTIHRAIYRRGRDGHFTLNENRLRRGLFIVDEASMLSADRDNPLFGSGSLLDDLVSYVYSSPRCYLVLVGDDAQLPPVGQTHSPALNPDFMAGYGLTVHHHVLTEVARQALDSTILANATAIRSAMHLTLDDLPLRFGPDFVRLNPADVSDYLERSYRDVGAAETLILTRSNVRTNIFNGGVRARILYREEMLSGGDRLMVSRNNYHTDEDDSADSAEEFVANGEMLEVVRLRHEREMYGFHFVEAELRGVDRDFEISRLLWLDTLTTDRPEDSQTLQATLFDRIAEDYPEVRSRQRLAELVKASPYYNALHVRYAYAVTCHKAQGGQWRHVYVDVPVTAAPAAANASSMMRFGDVDSDFRRWLYTAITRATERIYWIA